MAIGKAFAGIDPAVATLHTGSYEYTAPLQSCVPTCATGNFCLEPLAACGAKLLIIHSQFATKKAAAINLRPFLLPQNESLAGAMGEGSVMSGQFRESQQ
ncbi:hypothetical protein [Aestuariirhabdus sp. LZHN29]|uniref:hypothetical protein n=1 Tax=Aestuariirhabdus sp. LZHN29 TaxID=3417462 RepID=UPI003CF12EA5